jgi:T5SS/PEP-CTERM-associated repeat protein
VRLPLSILVALAAGPGFGEDNTMSVFDGVTTALVADIVVGDAGTNNALLMVNGASVAALDAAAGNRDTAGGNSIAVSGPQSDWRIDGLLVIGSRGDANVLTVSSGATVTAREGALGRHPEAAGNIVVVRNNGSAWSNRTGLTVGETGPDNVLRVEGGGHVWSLDADVGRGGAAHGNHVVVDSSGSVWQAASRLSVGLGTAGNRLTITNGGEVASTCGLVGARHTACSNTVALFGTGSAWRVASNLIVGVEGSCNRILVAQGARLESGPADIGDLPGSWSNSVTVTGPGSRWTARGPVAVGLDESGGALVIADGARFEAAGVSIGAGGTLDLDASADLAAVGPISNAGQIVTTAALSFSNDVVLAPGGRLLGPANATWSFGGDFINNSADPGLDFLHSSFAFAPGVGHALVLGCEDRSNRLSGFSSNNALGSLAVRGTVDVVNIVYVWSLSGDGRIDIGSGDRFYYADAGQWFGSVTVSGGGVFEHVPVSLGAPALQGDRSMLLTWPSGAGLRFGIEWSDDLAGAPFAAATNLVGTGAQDNWTDDGAIERAHPALAPQRLYRLLAWP